VIVVDAADKPIQGADVQPVSLSINGAITKTDAAGVADVPLSVGGQDAKWISITKAGYDPAGVDVPAQWPLRITLMPAGTAKLGVQLTTKP